MEGSKEEIGFLSCSLFTSVNYSWGQAHLISIATRKSIWWRTTWLVKSCICWLRNEIRSTFKINAFICWRNQDSKALWLCHCCMFQQWPLFLFFFFFLCVEKSFCSKLQLNAVNNLFWDFEAVVSEAGKLIRATASSLGSLSWCTLDRFVVG